MAEVGSGTLIAVGSVSGEYYFPAAQSDPLPTENRCIVVCAGRERCLAGYRVERGDFPYFALEFVASGSAQLTLGEAQVSLGPGSVFTYGPGVSHCVEAVRETVVKYFVDFSGPGAGVLLEQLELSPGSHRVSSSRRWLADLFDQLVACADAPRAEAAWFAGRLLELVLRRAGEETLTDRAPAGSARETYERCRRHIRHHAGRLMSVEKIAQECAVSPAYLVRLFNRYASESAYAFLRRLKMEMAADQLLAAGKTVKAAGAVVGYEDPYHFSRVFKQVQGLSPKAYRDRFHRRSG